MTDSYIEDFFTNERYLDLVQNGQTPEEFHFRFQCQNCGLRCCTYSYVETVRFAPHSFAYIRKLYPEKQLNALFELKRIEWDFHPQTHLPNLIIGGDLCPFLYVQWDNKIRTQFLRELKHLEIQADPTVLAFHTEAAKVFTSIYEQWSNNHSNDELMLVPVHEIYKNLIILWYQLERQNPQLFPRTEMLSITSGFFAIMRDPSFKNNPSNPDPLVFPAYCGIWPARSDVCKIFPLNRVTSLQIENSSTTGSPKITITGHTSKVLLQNDTCPSKAFNQKEAITAAQFLESKTTEKLYWPVMSQAIDFIQEQMVHLEKKTLEAYKQFYQQLISQLYYQIEYTSNLEKFYQQLNYQFSQFTKTFSIKSII